MSWDDLNRLHREGFDIQNHSWTHGRFYRPWEGESWGEYEKRVTLEVIKSKEILEKKIPGNEIYAFAFPMGYHNEYLEDRLKDSGYSMMLTVKADPVDVKGDFSGVIGRYTIQSGDLKKFKKRFMRQLEIAKSEYGSDDRSVTVADSPELSNPATF
jgi:peptidoglycan/xylan/chitin deacetylase (PgdA/CDA1 family)